MFTPEEKELLSKYVTSTEANVYAVKGMEGMAGAAYARYSRAKGGFRETLLKEFIKEGVVDPLHAGGLIERILIAYGDDSVGELEGAHVSFEKVTMLAAKEIEDRRIGGSPIEQSTRYVLYDQKDEQGNWLYYRGEELLNAPFGSLYIETMDFLFETYASLVEPLKTYLEQQKPLEEAEYDINGDGVKEHFSELTDERHKKDFTRTYTFELRAKACDILRYLLPIGTVTNVGMFGNGRFYQNLISYLQTTDIPENQTIAAGVLSALGEVIPMYVRRAKRSEYLAGIRNAMREQVGQLDLSGADTSAEPQYVLLDKTLVVEKLVAKGRSVREAIVEAQDIQTIAAMIYPYAACSLQSIVDSVASMSVETRQKIVQVYLGARAHRRDRPGRALEDGYPYTFDLLTDFGVYKDLQRHRMATQQRQLFTTAHGFIVPEELVAIGKREEVLACVQKSQALFAEMEKYNSELAQYAVLHGHLIRWTIGLNDRAAMHMFELRSTPQGHPSYRKAAQRMHAEVAKQSTWRAEAMQFVDYNDYYWSRADSEAAQRVKEAKLDTKLAGSAQ